MPLNHTKWTTFATFNLSNHKSRQMKHGNFTTVVEQCNFHFECKLFVSLSHKFPWKLALHLASETIRQLRCYLKLVCEFICEKLQPSSQLSKSYKTSNRFSQSQLRQSYATHLCWRAKEKGNTTKSCWELLPFLYSIRSPIPINRIQNRDCRICCHNEP